MTDPVESRAPLAPHPVLKRFYTGHDQRERYVRKIFDETAGDYDRLENLLGLGSGRWYRRHAIRRAGLVPGMRLLDIATGTGLVAREALTVLGGQGEVVCVDPSAGMLREARKSLSVAMVQGKAEHLPLAADQFDFLSMGYALRHVADLSATFREYHRVLKPGGRLCVLEISKPAGSLGLAALRFYMKRVFPKLARLTTRHSRNEELFQYYWDTIEGCLSPEQILAALREAGFVNVRRHVDLAIFSDYLADKPAC